MKHFFKLAMGAALMACFFSCSGEKEQIKLIPVKSGENYQYVNREGKIVINPQFSSASIFRDGIALVQTSGENPKWGYINEDGKYTINPTYVDATVFSEGIAWVVTENGAPVAIDTKGKTKFSMQDAQTVRVFKEGLAAFSTQDSIEEKWGFVDKSGKIKIPAQFTFAGNFSNGKCLIKNKDGKFGYIDSDGKIAINYQFNSAMEFQNNMAVVGLKDKAGVIDASGKYIINPQFDDIYPDGDMFAVKHDKKWGWCDKEGKIVINPQFDQIFPFAGEDLAAVKSGEMFGYINKEGKIVINPQFGSAFPFNSNLAMVSTGDKYGFVDGEGKYLVNPQFDAVSFDMVLYLNGKSSIYESVDSDFFNIGAITDKINLNAPDGLSLQDNAGQILTKLNKTPSGLSKYDDNQLIYSDKKLTNEASLSLRLLGNTFVLRETQWSYDRVFNPDFKTNGFIFHFSLSGKGYEKGLAVKEAFDKKLANFTKVKSGHMDEDEVSVYKDNSKYVVLSGNKAGLSLYFIKSDFDLSSYLSRIRSGDASREIDTAQYEDVAPVPDTAAVEY